jgi:hypothetical protein
MTVKIENEPIIEKNQGEPTLPKLKLPDHQEDDKEQDKIRNSDI